MLFGTLAFLPLPLKKSQGPLEAISGLAEQLMLQESNQTKLLGGSETGQFVTPRLIPCVMQWGYIALQLAPFFSVSFNGLQGEEFYFLRMPF